MFSSVFSLSLCGMSVWNELWLLTAFVYISLFQPGTALHDTSCEISQSEEGIMPVFIISYQFLHARVGARNETAILTQVSNSTTVCVYCVLQRHLVVILLFNFMNEPFLGIFVWCMVVCKCCPELCVTDDLEKVVSYMLQAKYKTPLILHTYCIYLIRNKAHCKLYCKILFQFKMAVFYLTIF